MSDPDFAVVLKGWPRLSETFIAQELWGLEKRGAHFEIWSLRHPTDKKTHPIHDEIRATAKYLPEYLHDEPWRVLRALMRWAPRRAFWRALKVWAGDLRRDFTLNRVRRFGQALVLAHELPGSAQFLYAHFLHTPGSVTRYAAMLRGLKWGFSAHAKDIWTIPEWEKREKLEDCAFGVTCTGVGAEHLAGLAPQAGRMGKVYHGLELERFPSPPEQRPLRDGAGAPVILLSVGRLVEKKGYNILLEALAALPKTLNWRFEHIGGGPLKDELAAQAQALGLTDRIEWRGAQAQAAVVEAMRGADIFVLPSMIAEGGDRDGLPNVLMEAASQKLPALSSDVSAIPEFIDSGQSGLLTPPGDASALAAALETMITQPQLRADMAEKLYARLTHDFGADAGFDAVWSRIKPHLSL